MKLREIIGLVAAPILLGAMIQHILEVSGHAPEILVAKAGVSRDPSRASINSCDASSKPTDEFDRLLLDACVVARGQVSNPASAQTTVTAAKTFLDRLAELDAASSDLVADRVSRGHRPYAPSHSGKFLMARELGVIDAYNTWRVETIQMDIARSQVRPTSAED